MWKNCLLLWSHEKKKNQKSHTREMPFDHQNFEKSFSNSSSIKQHKLLVLERRNVMVCNLDTHRQRPGNSMIDPAQRAESMKSPSHTRVFLRHTRGHTLRRSCLTALIVRNLSQSLVTWRHIQLFTKKRMYLNVLIMTSHSSILVVGRYTRSHRLRKSC